MIVDAEIWHWTREGMRRGDAHGGFIRVRDVEQLLEEAHERGRRGGLAAAAEIIRTEPVPV